MEKYIEELTCEEAIHAPTREIADKLFKKFDELGLRWASGHSYCSNYTPNLYRMENLCLYPKNGTHGNAQNCKGRVYTIDDLKDFKNMEKQNFSIEGTVALKKAFVEELNLTTSSEGSITEWKYLTNALKEDLCGVNTERGLHFKLPQQWDEAVIYVKEFFRKGPEFKIGDYIVAVGSTGKHRARKITAFKIEGNMFRWKEMGGCIKGEFPHSWNLSAVRHATPEEIEEYKNPKLPVINGYTGEDNGDTLKYGCAELSKKWFTKTANRSIQSMTLSSGVEINAEQIEKIRKYLDY